MCDTPVIGGRCGASAAWRQNGKLQIPNSKLQRKPKLQIPNDARAQPPGGWSLKLEASLDFGFWSLELFIFARAHTFFMELFFLPDGDACSRLAGAIGFPRRATLQVSP